MDILAKALSDVLARVASDYDLDHAELVAKYISGPPPAAVPQPKAPTATLCTAKTAKGAPCKYKPQKGSCVCKIHASKVQEPTPSKEPKEPPKKKKTTKKVKAAVPEHTHALTEDLSPDNVCQLCDTHGSVLDPKMPEVEFELADDLDEPDLAIAELEFAREAGLGAAWLPHRPCGGRSPGHVDFDPLWARLSEAKVPFVLHVGGAPLQLAKAWMNNGRPPTKDWLGGGENLRTKDIALLHEGPEAFLTMLVLDGVLERHPGLRGACVELGAGWAPELLRRLDWVVKHWSRNDANLQGLSRTPSEQMTEQLAFTPFVFEEVGRFIDQSNADLYLFSSDYPHIEGGRDPIGRFESALGDRSEAVRQKFYADNFLRIFAHAAG